MAETIVAQQLQQQQQEQDHPRNKAPGTAFSNWCCVCVFFFRLQSIFLWRNCTPPTLPQFNLYFFYGNHLRLRSSPPPFTSPHTKVFPGSPCCLIPHLSTRLFVHSPNPTLPKKKKWTLALNPNRLHFTNRFIIFPPPSQTQSWNVWFTLESKGSIVLRD